MNKAPVQPRRILVVDDEPFVCDAVKMMLAFDGHHVDTARSSKEALDIFAKGQYDLVITDYSMPGMKGDELATQLKALSPGVPVVLITAYAEMLRGSSEPLKGVDCMISKPFMLEQLREAIAKAMAGKPPAKLNS